MAKKKKRTSRKKKKSKGPKHRFQPGKDWDGNANGRPKGSKNKFSVKDLAEAIRKVEKEKKKQFLVHWVEQAWEHPEMMAAIMKKMLPDMKAVEMIGALVSEMSPAEARKIQERLKERFKV